MTGSAELVNLNTFRIKYFSKFQNLFSHEYGFYFAENRIEHFRSILLKFMKDSPVESFEEYYDYLSKTSPGRRHFQNLMDEVTIGETYFFRNLPQLEAFRDKIIPDLVKLKRSQGVNTIKIWSAGCSTGEEAYTLAMILMSTLPQPSFWKVQILGTDINRNVVDIANRGVYYGKRPERHLTTDQINNYFDRVGSDKIRIKESLKKWTRFMNHNLIRDEFNQPEMIDPDIIFCRNVTIYFNLETTKALVARFYDTLSDKGYFFIGHSETLWKISDKFRIHDFPKAFVYQKDTHYKKEAASLPKHAPTLSSAATSEKTADIDSPSKSVPKTEAATLLNIAMTHSRKQAAKDNLVEPSEMDLEKILKIDQLFHQGILYFERKDLESAVNCFDEIIDLESDYLLAHYAKSTILSNQGQYKEALVAIEAALKLDNLLLEAHYLKGLIYFKQDMIPEAIKTFQTVIYLDPDHVLSYFYLAQMYEKTGDLRQRVLALKNVNRICGKFEAAQIVPFSDHVTYATLGQLSEKALSNIL